MTPIEKLIAVNFTETNRRQDDLLEQLKNISKSIEAINKGLSRIGTYQQGFEEWNDATPFHEVKQ